MSRTAQAPGAPGLAPSLIDRALRSGRRAVLYAAIFSFVINALYLALPIYTQQVFVRVLSSNSAATLLVLTLAAVFIFAVSGYIEAQRDRVLDAFSADFDAQIGDKVLAALHADVTALRRPATAQALRDLDTVRSALSGRVLGVFFDLPWTPIFLIVLLVIDFWVGFVALAATILLLLFAFAQDRASRPANKLASEASIRSYAVTEAILRNSEAVRSMGMLPNLARRWSGLRGRSLESSLDSAHIGNVWNAAIRFVRMAAQILIIAMGAFLIIRGDIGPGLLFANMILSSRALAPIERGVASWAVVVNAALAYERLKETMANYVEPAPATQLPSARGELSVETMNFAINGTILLAGINFRVPAGEFLGVIGPSGSGKSTLVRVLSGVWKPLNGVVRLDGADVFTWDRATLGRQMGYLPQDTELFDGTVRDNIARFDLDVTDEEVVAAAHAANAHEMIVRLPAGYDTVLGPGGVVLSAGQRQRVGLARALLRNPALIILDEPNSNLDQVGEEALLAALAAAKARGATIVVVSHKPSLLRDADKLVVIKGGRMELFGPKEAVMARLAQNQAAQAAQPAPPAQAPASPAPAAAPVAGGKAASA